MSEEATQTHEEETRDEGVDDGELGVAEDVGVEDPIGDQAAEGVAVESRRPRLNETPEEREKRVTGMRLAQAREVAGGLRHKRGCPDEGMLPGDGDSRVEHYPAKQPATANTPEEALLVIRCSRCGEAEVVPDESEA